MPSAAGAFLAAVGTAASCFLCPLPVIAFATLLSPWSMLVGRGFPPSPAGTAGIYRHRLYHPSPPPALHRWHHEQARGLLHGRGHGGRGAGPCLRQEDGAFRGPGDGAEELSGAACPRLCPRPLLRLPERALLPVPAGHRAGARPRAGPPHLQVCRTPMSLDVWVWRGAVGQGNQCCSGHEGFAPCFQCSHSLPLIQTGAH